MHSGRGRRQGAPQTGSLQITVGKLARSLAPTWERRRTGWRDDGQIHQRSLATIGPEWALTILLTIRDHQDAETRILPWSRRTAARDPQGGPTIVTGLSRRRSRVRVPSAPPFEMLKRGHLSGFAPSLHPGSDHAFVTLLSTGFTARVFTARRCADRGCVGP